MGKVFKALKRADEDVTKVMEAPSVPDEPIYAPQTSAPAVPPPPPSAPDKPIYAPQASAPAVPPPPPSVPDEPIYAPRTSTPAVSPPPPSAPDKPIYAPRTPAPAASPPPTAMPNKTSHAPRASTPTAPPPPTTSVDAANLSHPGQWDDRLVLATASTGPVAESIRALRTRILFPASGKPPRTILVTSASPGEGKSFICANLGISLAQGVDNYCLLVDCDLRKPMQHTLFGQSNTVGLSDYLRHRTPIPDLLCSPGVEKLSLLLAGPRSINPAELLGSAAMSRLMDELAQRYDDRIVLLDSPPIHAASETAVLAQHVDGVVLVVRSGLARREYVKALAETIGRDKILGIVFNAYRATMLDYRVFGYYEYQKDYYYGEQ